ncbi:MAG: GIY-YIG nuclease family protein [Pisciglobus halotolerans]|nr:GIY-YIG nuclease family protein [Pisciglobus halotolerans]
MDENCGIYQIVNKVNGKIYVGQSKHVRHRKISHLNQLRKGTHYNRHMQRSFDSYGESNFVFEVIEFCGSGVLNERERYWINKKETEYSNKGYNSSYAVTKFNQYDSKRKLNGNNRTPTGLGRKMSDEHSKRLMEGATKYFSEEVNREKASLTKSTIDIKKIRELKERLVNEVGVNCAEIAREMNIKQTIVTHTAQGNCYLMIAPELNEKIRLREIIYNKRIDKQAISLYRGGYSYAEIAFLLRIHELNKIKNLNDERMRLNRFNRICRLNYIRVRTLRNAGKKDVEIATMFGKSRSYIYDVRTAYEKNKYKNVKSARKPPKLLET